MDLYKEEILDHYKNPHNFGDLDEKTHQARDLNASCGDMVEVYLKIEKEIIIDAGFRGVGCALSTASASLLTDEVKGKRVDEVMVWDEKILRKLVGEVNPGRMKCITLPLEVLQKAIGQK